MLLSLLGAYVYLVQVNEVESESQVKATIPYAAEGTESEDTSVVGAVVILVIMVLIDVLLTVLALMLTVSPVVDRLPITGTWERQDHLQIASGVILSIISPFITTFYGYSRSDVRRDIVLQAQKGPYSSTSTM